MRLSVCGTAIDNATSVPLGVILMLHNGLRVGNTRARNVVRLCIARATTHRGMGPTRFDAARQGRGGPKAQSPRPLPEYKFPLSSGFGLPVFSACWVRMGLAAVFSACFAMLSHLLRSTYYPSPTPLFSPLPPSSPRGRVEMLCRLGFLIGA
jgi:hypothetical protein